MDIIKLFKSFLDGSFLDGIDYNPRDDGTAQPPTRNTLSDEERQLTKQLMDFGQDA